MEEWLHKTSELLLKIDQSRFSVHVFLLMGGDLFENMTVTL